MSPSVPISALLTLMMILFCNMGWIKQTVTKGANDRTDAMADVKLKSNIHLYNI